ncbi:MAG: ATP-binding protein [Steroidobacteraceae bacterium]
MHAGLLGALRNVTVLDRPTSSRTLVSSVQAALRARERQYQMREQFNALRQSEAALRERERHLRSLAENTPDILSRFDRNLRHVFINRAGADALGLSHAQFLGRTSRELGLPAAVCDRLEETLREVFETGQQRSLELVQQSAHAPRYYTHLLVPEIGETGEIETVLSVAHDLTEIRQVADALDAANRRKDEFLAMLAHELRNPLSPISNAGEILSRILAEDARAQVVVGMIKRQAAHLTRLVDDLLDVARLTQGRIQLRRRPIELASIITQAVETIEPQLREKRHELSVTTSISHKLAYVSGDSARLVQCVVNLLTNAVKYTDPGGEIWVRTRADDSRVLIEVTDSGAGISPELMPRIFDLFVQSDRTLDRSQGGLGIGLAVVRRLIEMHGGEVSARSPGVGHGSTFEIQLPRVARPQAPSPEGTEIKAPRRRVLIVDDNADAANSLAFLLNMQGHEAEAVYGGKDALERIASFRPDVGLLDIGLPEMDGYELVRRLREMTQLNGIRLIAVSGYGQAEDLQRTRAAGFDDHLVKPVDLPSLERALAGMPAAGFRERE